MEKTILLNVSINLVLAAAMLLLNTWALQNNLEETFISLALLYGLAVIIVNASFLWIVGGNKR